MKKFRKQVQSNAPTQQKPLRLWPGVVFVILLWLIRFGLPLAVPADVANQIGMLGAILFSLFIILWWAFFSRAPRVERWGGIILMIVSLIVSAHFVHVSIATGMMGMMFLLYSIPVMCLALVAWAVTTRNLSNKVRRISMVITILLASGMWLLLRTNGMTGDGQQDFAWRWSKTAEEKLLAENVDQPTATLPVQTALETGAGWTGFRGPNRDGIIHGLRIKTDWNKTPPVEMWRRPVGPACSSFAVQGNLFYTQEQLGDDEIVSCYNLLDGKAVWKHKDKVRFYESHSGAGPRSTPTLAGGRVYTLGATGTLNVLDARTGTVKWSRNAATDAKVKVLQWGFSGSPLVVGDLVIVSLSGKLAAYDTASGKPRWYGPDGGNSYSSPQLFTINGIPQVLLMSKSGAISFNPSEGKQLWKYAWPTMVRILQPAAIGTSDLLFVEETKGARRVSVTHDQGAWNVKERWTSDKMLHYFNDFVIHKDHVYGFDGPGIACADIKDGTRNWKGDRYRGWILLLADQDLLLVLSEKGDLALVEANPSQFKEVARIKAFTAKTWNHPALVGNVLLVRNSEEMVAYRLPS